ncbi:MAG: sterol desaturase family protein [Candidatus Odyssella sp.]|nr:sterol desaturase family protein [Candidatus Odyssella sp.]
MPWATLETTLRADGEVLQYAAFFGALAALAALETLWPRGADAPARRRRWPANFGLTLINIVVLGALPIGALAAADWAQMHGWGLLHAIAPDGAVAFALGLLLRSLVGYATHVAMHKIPLLWRVHRVHHADRAFDVSTTVRFHPLEFVIALPILLAAVAMLGISPLAIIVYEIFDAAMAVWTHANLRLPARLSRALSFVLVTPDMHRIHHSAHQPETDSNYGATFSVWDRLFRTFREAAPDRLSKLTLGLETCRDGRAESLPWLLTMPWRALATARATGISAASGARNRP